MNRENRLRQWMAALRNHQKEEIPRLATLLLSESQSKSHFQELLMHAAAYGNIAMLQAALLKATDLDEKLVIAPSYADSQDTAPVQYQPTALGTAIANGHVPAAMQLLAWGADLHKVAPHLFPRLPEIFLYATAVGCIKALSALVRWIGDVNYVMDPATLLAMQAKWDEHLVYEGTDGYEYTRPVKYEPTPLATALTNDRRHVVAFLLTWGADGKREAAQLQPRLQELLVHAATFGEVEAIEALLELGAEASGSMELQVTHHTAIEGDYTATYQHTPLQGALDRGQLAAASCLLSHGAEVDLRDLETGDSVLHKAIKHISSKHEVVTLVTLLLYHGASVEVRDYEGNTPLHLATACGSLPLVKTLIQAGCDPQAVNNSGKTPLEIATRYKEATILGRRRRRIAQYLQRC